MRLCNFILSQSRESTTLNDKPWRTIENRLAAHLLEAPFKLRRWPIRREQAPLRISS